MQVASGHFSMWGGDSSVNEMLTPYIVEFLLDAREDGFLVPDGVLQKALQRLNDDLLSGGHPFYGYEHADHLRFADQAYAGYVLARVNRAPLGTLRALFDDERGKSVTALPLVHLGIALKLMGDAPRAQQALAGAEVVLQRGGVLLSCELVDLAQRDAGDPLVGEEVLARLDEPAPGRFGVSRHA
jgi:uncharacterized protein YfaS (alpha-2-macroglobulin family)